MNVYANYRAFDHTVFSFFFHSNPRPVSVIIWWELPEQKYQKCVCQHTDAVQTGQVGWMMLMLQWKMVKLNGRSALVIVLTVANMQSEFQSKIVILLHLQTLPTCLLLTLLWYRLNVKQKIQEIRELIKWFSGTRTSGILGSLP